MSELILAPESAPTETVGTGAVVEGSAPVLITEQEVLFATAAAVRPAPRTAGRRWWRIGRYVTATETSEPEGDRRIPRYVARRYSFIEDAAMARAMYRL